MFSFPDFSSFPITLKVICGNFYIVLDTMSNFKCSNNITCFLFRIKNMKMLTNAVKKLFKEVKYMIFV